MQNISSIDFSSWKMIKSSTFYYSTKLEIGTHSQEIWMKINVYPMDMSGLNKINTIYKKSGLLG